jgi:ABC-type multidrug transport system ATPase subunit
MISFSNIHKQYGKQLLFVDASFQLNPGETVGLVGPNGSGKTTLFRMVVGEETPDEGAVSENRDRRDIHRFPFVETLGNVPAVPGFLQKLLDHRQAGSTPKRKIAD